MKRAALCTVILLAAGAALAKLPPPSEADKAKAAEAAARTAWSNSVGNYQLCKAMDRVAERYRADAAKGAKELRPAAPTPPCVDLGPFAFTPPRPLEAAGAHSPPQTAAQPPSTKVPAAAVGKKQ